MNIKNLPIDKKTTPDELFIILNENYVSDLIVYKKIRNIAAGVFSLGISVNTYLYFSSISSENINSATNAFSEFTLFLFPIVTALCVILLLRTHLKPDMPTFQDALDWHEIKDRVVYKIVPDKSKIADVVNFSSKINK